ncbi:MAG: hypothetical protein ACI4EJ_09945 [Bacteroides sp.]
MVFKNVFCSKLYKETFSKYLRINETTHEDEIFVDMAEPMGDKISYLYMKNAHSVSDCKAFVTTTDERVLIAVYNLFGEFHKCYIINHISLYNIETKKVFGGQQISFEGQSQYGNVSVKMYVPSKQFGTDLKAQDEHLKLFVENLNKIKENPKSFIDERCIISSIVENDGWVHRSDNELIMKYYKMKKITEPIDWKKVAKSPVRITDVGLGGGERYVIRGSNGIGECIDMITGACNIRLIYGDEGVAGTFWGGGDGRVTICSEHLVLVCTLDECDIEFL